MKAGRMALRKLSRDGAPEIEPESVDWSVIDKKNFSYKLVQEPGPLNALGRIIILC